MLILLALFRHISANSLYYSWSAVARGAVLWGLQGDLVVDKRKCRRHYGTELLKHFDPMIHDEVDAMVSTFSGLKMARNQISWIINRVWEPPDLTKNYQQADICILGRQNRQQ